MKKMSLNEKNIINIFRTFCKKNNDFKKNDIANVLGIQWNTVSNAYKQLVEKNIFIEKDEVALNLDFEYYVGVSLGSSRVKIVFLDFSFEYCDYENKNIFTAAYDEFKKRYIDYIEDDYVNGNQSTPMKLCLNLNFDNENFGSNPTAFILNDICKMINDMKVAGTKIGAVGFAFPGLIDRKNKKILSSYLFGNASGIGLKDLVDDEVYNRFEELFGEENSYIFAQNCIAATIAEKEWGTINQENTAVIYGGYGYGIGLIIGNRLYTEGGQLGHMSVIPNKSVESQKNPLCRCGQQNCLENRINTDVFEKEQDKEQVLKSKSTEELIEMLNSNVNKKIIISDYLSQAIYNIVQLMGINNIVLTGKLSKLYECISKELKNALINTNMTSQVIRKSEIGEFSAAVGVAIQAYYEKYSIPIEWKY